MFISAKRNPAMSEGTWQRFLQREGLDIVDYLLGANCQEVSIIEDGRLTHSITRADLIATLCRKVEGKPEGERWLIPPADVEILTVTLLALAHRVAQALGNMVQVPLASYGFRVNPEDTLEQVISAYRSCSYDVMHG